MATSSGTSALATNSELDRVIRELKKHIGKNWKKLARSLKFTQTDIDAIIEREPRDLEEQIHRFFYKWKMMNGDAANVEMLKHALIDAKLVEILNKLERELASAPDLTVPQQETSPKPARVPSAADIVRQKRLERFSSSGSDGSVGRQVSRSVSSSSNAPASDEPDCVSQDSPSRKPSNEFTNESPRTLKPTERDRFEVGDLVKVEGKSVNPWYGVIKWIGQLDGIPGDLAGIETEEPIQGGHTGQYKDTEYFTCENGHGIFLRISQLKRDDRFSQPPRLQSAAIPEGEEVEKDKDGTQTATIPTIKPIPVPGCARIDEAELLSEATGSATSDVHILQFYCPGDQVGRIIGKDGRNINRFQEETSTRIQVAPRNRSSIAANATILILGTKENCEKALLKILTHVKRNIDRHTSTSETILIPNQEQCGRVIGKKGSTRKTIETITQTRIDIEDKPEVSMFDALFNLSDPGPRKCKITGSSEAIKNAKELIKMAQEGADIVWAAQTAALLVKLKEEFIKQGYEFSKE